MENSISVILSGYRRPETLIEQYESIKKQTIAPSEILFWKNDSGENLNFSQDIINKCKSSSSNYNFGVWARFAYALNCTSKYICIFDDDTIPGERWLENCLDSFKQKPGLYGTIGLIFRNEFEYYYPIRVGWDGFNNEQIMEVDIVGHSWFFSRDMLSYFWRELPSPEYIYAGEDMHFSYMIQKYSNLKTYVPPHPPYDKSLWGSLKGWEYGNDGKATASFAVPTMNRFYIEIISKGFKLISAK